MLGASALCVHVYGRAVICPVEDLAEITATLYMSTGTSFVTKKSTDIYTAFGCALIRWETCM